MKQTPNLPPNDRSNADHTNLLIAEACILPEQAFTFRPFRSLRLAPGSVCGVRFHLLPRCGYATPDAPDVRIELHAPDGRLLESLSASYGADYADFDRHPDQLHALAFFKLPEVIRGLFSASLIINGSTLATVSFRVDSPDLPGYINI